MPGVGDAVQVPTSPRGSEGGAVDDRTARLDDRVPHVAREPRSPQLPMSPTVPRDSLLARMAAALPTAAVVVVHAAAGFGKTTLLEQFTQRLRERGAEIAWLTLEPADNDVSRLLGRLAAVMSSWTAAPDASAARLRGLVIDEFECLENPAAVDTIDRLLARDSGSPLLLIGSRSVPAIRLGRLRAKGRVLEITEDALRFTREETRAFFAGQPHVRLTDQDLSLLQSGTEGWPAVLRLASLSLADRPDTSAFIAGLAAKEEVGTYLVEDVLERQPERVRAFLRATSMLGRLCAALCDHLLQSSDGQELLETVERRHLFLRRLDPEGRWFQYHPIFSRAIAAVVERQDAVAWAGMHRRAAEWWADHGDPVRALQHAAESADQTTLTALLERHAEPLLWDGRARALSALCAHATIRRCVERDSRLAWTFAWAMVFCHRYDAASAFIERMASGDGTHAGAGIAVSEFERSALRAFVAAMSDRLVEASSLWRECEPFGSPAQPFSYAILNASYGCCLIAASDFEGAKASLARSTEGQRADGRSFLVPVTACVASTIDLVQGRVDSAYARLRNAFEIKPGRGVSSPDNVIVAGFLAEVLYERGALSESARLLCAYLPRLVELAAPDQLILAFVLSSRLAAHRNDWPGAKDVLTEMETIGHRYSLARMVARARLERGRLALLRGRFDVARSEVAAGAEPGLWRSFGGLIAHAEDIEDPDIAMARLALLERPEVARVALTELTSRAEHLGRARRALKTGLLLGFTECRLGELRPGAARIASCLRTAVSHGLSRTVLDESWELRTWHSAVRTALGDEPESIALLDAALADSTGGTPTAREPEPVERTACATPPDGLTVREREVLRQLAKGQRNKQIARELFLSETTVKAHLRNINAKLGSSSRLQAIATARTLGLLDR